MITLAQNNWNGIFFNYQQLIHQIIQNQNNIFEFFQCVDKIQRKDKMFLNKIFLQNLYHQKPKIPIFFHPNLLLQKHKNECWKMSAENRQQTGPFSAEAWIIEPK